jgi:hypothetical protein
LRIASSLPRYANCPVETGATSHRDAAAGAQTA